MKVQRRYLVAGRVQGVGFRHFVWRTAGELGLSGWVRNLSDGRVEVVASADEGILRELRSRLEQGPRMARVDAVMAEDDSEADVPSGFEVRR